MGIQMTMRAKTPYTFAEEFLAYDFAASKLDLLQKKVDLAN